MPLFSPTLACMDVRKPTLTFTGQRSAASSADARRTVFQRCTGDREETEEIRRETEEVEVCTAPQWTRNKFRFSIGPLHHYLNICVYDRLCGEERGELLIGHVSLHLEFLQPSLPSPGNNSSHGCVPGVSGLLLWQAPAKICPLGTRACSSLLQVTSDTSIACFCECVLVYCFSRAAVQASEERRGSRGRGRQSERVARLQVEGKKYVGALLLQFRHSSKWKSATAWDEEEACDSPVSIQLSLTKHIVSFMQQELEVGSHIPHEFHTMEKTGPQKCHICYKRV